MIGNGENYVFHRLIQITEPYNDVIEFLYFDVIDKVEKRMRIDLPILRVTYGRMSVVNKYCFDDQYEVYFHMPWSMEPVFLVVKKPQPIPKADRVVVLDKPCKLPQSDV